jgi:parallel beta-helix repeat protein
VQIQTALNACVAYGPGCTVQLAAGTYLTQQLLTKNFHGTFKGRGMDVTIIQALPNLLVNQQHPVWKYLPSASNPYPMLILFFGGDITVSDMTIKALEPNPLKEGFYEFEGELRWNSLWSLLEFMGQSEEMNAVVTRVALEGTYDESAQGYDHYNAAGLSMDPYPPWDTPSPGHLSGTFRVSASRFDTLMQGIFFAVLHDTRLIIGGSPSEANLIQNCDMSAVFIDLDSSVVDFSHNDVSVVGPGAWGGFVAYQALVVPIAAPSSFLVHDNYFKATGSYEDGIALVDFGPVSGDGKTGDFVISNNMITLGPGELATWAGVEAVHLDGAVISNNRIVGSSTLGISLEGASQCMVEGNNVQRLQPSWAPVGLLGVSLGMPDTTYCTVLGGNNKTNVYDEGVNNTLVGVNNMQGNPPGPAIKAAMQRKMEMIKSLRKP